MGKLELIKTKLASLLIEVKFESIKTDKAILEIEGELKEGVDAFVIDAETKERVAAADGEYVTEENKVITIAEGKVVSIVEKEEEPAEEPKEEPKPEDDLKAAEEPADEPKEEPKEEPKTEEPKEEPKEEEKDEVAELKSKVEEMAKTIEELKAAIEELKATTLEKLQMSAALPATEEFDNIKTPKKTGNTKVDRFLERYGNK